VFAELDSIFEDDLTRPITSSDLRKMEYVEMVIKESLRVHSVGPFIMREVDCDFQLGEPS